MPDIQKSLIEAYLTFVCQMAGIDELEGYRKYQTDLKFRSGIDAMAQVALNVFAEYDGDVELLNLDLFHDVKFADAKVPAEKEPLWDAFQQGLLGT